MIDSPPSTQSPTTSGATIRRAPARSDRARDDVPRPIPNLQSRSLPVSVPYLGRRGVATVRATLSSTPSHTMRYDLENVCLTLKAQEPSTRVRCADSTPVSYTHLTLPTIYSV